MLTSVWVLSTGARATLEEITTDSPRSKSGRAAHEILALAGGGTARSRAAHAEVSV
ncbi:MAG TPA: hypothetical protein VGV67_02030 [Solirubrobacteraceae bacterium]|nr:hypothetical protein [Solirubrobacteraceae bacterium]